MLSIKQIAALALLLMMESIRAEAVAPCDPSVEIKDCRARISVDKSGFDIRTDTRNCARVDWEVDGIKRSSAVLDGEGRFEITGSKPRGATVSACTEIKDLRTGNGHPAPDSEVSFPANCTIEGNDTVIESIIVDGHYPTAESRLAAARAACKPTIERAILRCSLDKDAIQAELESLVNDFTQRPRRAQLREQLIMVQEPRPAYCPYG